MATKYDRFYRTTFSGAEERKFLPPYLQGCPKTPVEIECPIEGELPTWVRGTLLRGGCGQYILETSDDGSTKPVVLQHWFDGLMMLHKFRIEDGKVYYMSKHTANGVIDRVKIQGFYDSPTVGISPNQALSPIDPCSVRLGAQQSVFTKSSEDAYERYLPPDAVNINVIPRRAYAVPDDGNPLSRGKPADNPAADEFLISSDFNMLQICDAKTLEPKRLFTYAVIDKTLEGAGICAHQGKDRKRRTEYNDIVDSTGITYVFGLDTGSHPAKLLWKAPIFEGSSYAHSIAVTGKYVVFVRQPISIDARKKTEVLTEVWDIQEGEDTLFYVMDKDAGKLISTYRVPGFFYFHTVNAYDFTDEVSGRVTVHVDICSYPTTHIPGFEYSFANILDPMVPLSDGTLVRYELDDVLGDGEPADVRRGSVRQAIHAGVELPRIRKDYSTVPGYRYVWAICENGGPSPGTQVPIGRLGNGVKNVQRAFLGHLVKTDWKTGEVIHWYPTDGESSPCEPVFVERPGSTEEDDGVLLTIVCNRDGTNGIFVVLDGRTMKEVARADMPQVFGLGFHGTFIEA